jgi:hypothetical protein
MTSKWRQDGSLWVVTIFLWVTHALKIMSANFHDFFLSCRHLTNTGEGALTAWAIKALGFETCNASETVITQYPSPAEAKSPMLQIQTLGMDNDFAGSKPKSLDSSGG